MPQRLKLCIDLFCGLDGWGEAFLSEGYEVIGYDIVDMAKEIGRPRMPGLKLALRDVLTIHGREFKTAACIVASPPCQAYSYRAMPWNPLWQEQCEMDDDGAPPIDHRVPDPIFNTLFMACFRIQREASEAAGRHIPMVVENVRGAQKWVGRAKWHFGSFYLWGDVPALMPALMPVTMSRAVMKEGVTHRSDGSTNFHKVPGFRFDGSGKSFQSASVEGLKVSGIKLSEVGFNVAAAQRYREGQKGIPHTPSGHWTNPEENGTKQGGDWFGKNCETSIPRLYGSKSPKRKAASAHIAKIPFPLASHIARVFSQ